MVATICIVIGSLERGGAEMHLARLLPQLDSGRFKPEVFTLTGRGACAPILEAAGIEVSAPSGDRWRRWRNPALKALLLVSRACALLWHFLVRRPDAAHFFLPASYLVGAPVAIVAGVRPRLMSRRSLNDYQKKKPHFLAWLERMLHRRMDMVLGNSQAVVDQLVGEEGLPADRCRLIYNGIAMPDVAEGTGSRTRRSLGLGDDVVVMSIVANLIPYKGHADLIDACARLGADTPFVLLIIGNDSAGIEAALRDRATAAGLDGRVMFLGARDDVPDLLAASDVGLLTSHEEGFSNAVLESMAAGLPMVVTDVGGNAEAVDDGVTGFVTPPRDPDALAQALARLLADPDLRRKMGRAGRERVRERFSMAACIAAYESLYGELLAARKRRA